MSNLMSNPLSNKNIPTKLLLGALGGLGVVVVLSSLLKPVTATGMKNGLFILYYGDPIANSQKIIAADPAFLVIGDGQTNRSDIASLYHQHNIKVMPYTHEQYGSRDISGDIRNAMEAGFDGLFLDENLSSTDSYNASAYNLIKSYGSEKIVIVNPGTADLNPRIFQYADIVCVENAYDKDLTRYKQPPQKFMAVQGDPGSWAATSAQDALNRLSQFRNNGGYWYYSPPHASSGATHYLLPSWLQEFANAVKAMR